MLFDLRGRGRRRAIQVIYLTLAVLIGGGLVLFGIGGATSGGLVDAISQNGGQSVDDTAKENADSAQQRTTANPRDAKAWADLARARFQQAGAGDNFDRNSAQGFTPKGLDTLRVSTRAWERHVALNPNKPDDQVASLMVQAYSALKQFDKAVGAQEIVTEQRTPSTGLYSQLAAYAYQAGQTRKGDLASKRAVELAPKDNRTQVKAALESAKQQAAQQAVQDAQGAAGSGGTAAPSAPGG